ncbi:MAG: DJ-1/PfpI family protein, partial [Phocaeicola sp.]|nr:DJ-1/PfpI family protein [Phocaeicola sp.]
LYLLLDNYADHESVFLASAINCDENGIRKNPKYINKVVTPTLTPIRSCGGFQTIPDYSFDTMPEEYAALILIGGYGWLDDKTSDKVIPIVRKAIEKGIIVGAICNAASFLAKHGFLNNVKHTGNGLEQLKLWGGNNYTNQAGYINEQAVSDKRIVTANGTGELEFAKELLLLLENDTPEQIEMFYRFNKDGFIKMMQIIK